MTLGRIWYGFLSLVILATLGAQGVASFHKTNQWWPFIWYPMYAHAHYDDEKIIVRHSAYVVLPDGKRHFIDPTSDLHLGHFRFEAQLAGPLVKGQYARLPKILGVVLGKYPSLQVLEVDDYPLKITREGPVFAPIKTVSLSRRAIDKIVGFGQ